nr:MAG TPA: YhdB-like protein [Caudoviricetes sp.]
MFRIKYTVRTKKFVLSKKIERREEWHSHS